MIRLPVPYRLVAALLSGTMLAGIALPVLQHACAGPASPPEASPAMHAVADAHGAVTAHGAVDHGAVKQEATHPEHQPDGPYAAPHAPQSEASPLLPCPDVCPMGTCCTVESAPAEVPDVRLPVRTELDTDVLALRPVNRVAVPVPDRTAHPPHRSESPPLSSVRLHVWTATFLK